MNPLKLFWKGLKEGFHSFGTTINTIINTLLLLVIYLVGVGLTSLFAKLVRKHFLEMILSKNRLSYWSDLNLKKKPMKEYYRQF